MLAQKKTTSTSTQRPPLYSNLPGEWHRIEVPHVPSMATALVTLQILLNDSVGDLETITQVVREDVGLTIQLLRLSGSISGNLLRMPLSFGKLVVIAGQAKLREMVAEAPVIGESLLVTTEGCSSFWLRSRQTARTAEQVAAEVFPELQETAYIAGLLRHMGELPALLGWRLPGLDSAGPDEIGYRMARSWNFPNLLAEVIGGDEHACRSSKSQWLLRLIRAAEPAILRG